MADVFQKIASKLYDGEDQEVAELVREALDQGVAPRGDPSQWPDRWHGRGGTRFQGR